MSPANVPSIFSASRRQSRERRSAVHQQRANDAAKFILEDACEDMIERLSFVRAEPKKSLLLGLPQPELIHHLGTRGSESITDTGWDPESPLEHKDCDFIGVSGILDAINDLPGALIHIRNALAPGGLAIVSFVGGASLPKLRAAMLAADGDRPAARIHPMVDPRAAPQLLQRAGWKDPVVDTHTLSVRYSSLRRLIQDLRDQGLGSALADRAPSLGKAALARAEAAFADQANADGKVTETFEIVTLTGRRSLAGT